MWVKLEKANREESEPQEFSYLPSSSFIQHYGRFRKLEFEFKNGFVVRGKNMIFYKGGKNE